MLEYISCSSQVPQTKHVASWFSWPHSWVDTEPHDPWGQVPAICFVNLKRNPALTFFWWILWWTRPYWPFTFRAICVFLGYKEKDVEVEFVDSYTVISQWNLKCLGRDCQLQVESSRSHVSSGWPNPSTGGFEMKICEGKPFRRQGATILVLLRTGKKILRWQMHLGLLQVCIFLDRTLKTQYPGPVFEGIRLAIQQQVDDSCGSWAVWHGERAKTCCFFQC